MATPPPRRRPHKLPPLPSNRYALHVWPGNVEFYTQCVDGEISSTSTVKPDSIAAYSIIKPPIYPSEFKTGFRNPYAP